MTVNELVNKLNELPQDYDIELTIEAEVDHLYFLDDISLSINHAEKHSMIMI